MHSRTDRGDRPVTQPSTTARPAMAETVAWVYCALGAAMVVALVALRDTELAAAPVAVMGIGAAIAAAVGLGAQPAAGGHPVAAVLAGLPGLHRRRRPAAGPGRQPAQPAGRRRDPVRLRRHLMAAFIGLLRCRQSNDRAVHELVDGAIVLVAVGAVALATLTVPTAEAVGMSWFAVVQGAYPVIDAVMIFVAILLSWTSASRVTSFWLLGLSVVFILIGDVGYAHIATQGADGRLPAARPAVRRRLHLLRRRRPAPLDALPVGRPAAPGAGLVARPGRPAGPDAGRAGGDRGRRRRAGLDLDRRGGRRSSSPCCCWCGPSPPSRTTPTRRRACATRPPTTR